MNGSRARPAVPAGKVNMPGTYGWFARYYDLLAASERRPTRMGIGLLAPERGQRIVEIGCGPGRASVELAARVGSTGRVDAVDLSPQMIELTKSRLGRAGLTRTASTYRADARHLPFPDETFDAAFMSFTLELFSNEDRLVVLGECRRVLRTHGRLAVVSLDKPPRPTAPQRVYVWLHRHFPQVIDCRPIDVDGALRRAGFQPARTRRISLWGLPVGIVVATLQPGEARSGVVVTGSDRATEP